MRFSECINSKELSPIVSDELFDCTILNNTPEGKIITPGLSFFIPADTFLIRIVENEIKIKSINILNVSTYPDEHSKLYKFAINYVFSFKVQFMDIHHNIFKIKCETEEYPLPYGNTVLKDYLNVSTTYHKTFLTSIFVRPSDIQISAAVQLSKVYGELIVESIYYGFYDINYEPYIIMNTDLNFCSDVDICWYPVEYYSEKIIIFILIILIMNEYNKKSCYYIY